jgi:hypothetical protein
MVRQPEENRSSTAVPRGRGRGPCGRLAGLQRSGHLGRCPVPGCRAQIDSSRLMCRSHWYLVPKQIRDRVWATWRSGQGAHSVEHLESVRMAITACQPAAS